MKDSTKDITNNTIYILIKKKLSGRLGSGQSV